MPLGGSPEVLTGSHFPPPAQAGEPVNISHENTKLLSLSFWG